MAFDVPFALLAIGIGYLSVERRRLREDRESPRFWIGVGALALSVLLALASPPLALTPWTVSLVLAGLAVWLFRDGPRLLGRGRDPFGTWLLLAAGVWIVGLLGLLTVGGTPQGVPWYLAGGSRPLGAALIFLGLLREQIQLPRQARARERELLAALDAQVSLALEKSRSVEQLQRDLRRIEASQAQLIQTDKLKALGTLLSGMAHELNNPLSTIQLSVQLLKRQQALPDAIRKRMDVVEEECERAARIIRELLVFARRKPPERKPVDLNETIRATLALRAPELEQRGIRVVTELAPSPAIWGDAAQLQQVLLHLFGNAGHAMKSRSGGTLTVRSRERDGGVVIEVEDTGPGIPPEHLTRVFDPFFTTKGVGEGTGLGLSVSIGIVEAHGGSMRVDNVAGAGARVTLRLPIGEPADATPTPAEALLPDLPRSRILLIEDEPSLRSVLVEVLTGLGHTVVEAATGQAGLQRLERGTYDLIALDLKLPDADGRTIWRWLHQHRPDLTSRVLFMTGDTLSAETEKFLQEAGRPVLSKPLAIAQVVRMIDQVLSRA
jgi:two-component system NtrC family sensor kinase